MTSISCRGDRNHDDPTERQRPKPDGRARSKDRPAPVQGRPGYPISYLPVGERFGGYRIRGNAGRHRAELARARDANGIALLRKPRTMTGGREAESEVSASGCPTNDLAAVRAIASAARRAIAAIHRRFLLLLRIVNAMLRLLPGRCDLRPWGATPTALASLRPTRWARRNMHASTRSPWRREVSALLRSRDAKRGPSMARVRRGKQRPHPKKGERVGWLVVTRSSPRQTGAEQ
jgi:hypothetical protein